MRALIFGLFIWLLPLFAFGQSIQKQLDLGEKLVLKITPLGHRVTDKKWIHTYQIAKSDSNYLVILTQDNETTRKILTKKELNPFIKYIKKWRTDKPKSFGHSQDGIILIIGDKKETFNAPFKSDMHLLDFIHKDGQTNPIKMGVR